MKKMRFPALFLVLILALAACGGNQGDVPQNQSALMENAEDSVQEEGSAAQEGEDAALQEVIAPVESYTFADMTDLDPYGSIVTFNDVDFSRQPAFTTMEALDGYFRNCMENRCRNIVFTCSRELRVNTDPANFCDTYHLAWINPKMQPGEYGKHYVINVTYYPGDNVAWAYLNDDKSMLCEEELALYDTATAWLEENISEEMSDYDKCVAIHDYLSGNVRYSDELLAALNTSFTFDWGITAYGAMVDHLTICQGYADAFDMLTSMLEMNCTQVTGLGGGEAHNWTMVELDGNWYHVDCTWDATAFGGGDGTSSKEYLFLSDEQMRPTHSWDAGEYPACTDGSLWYYTAKGLTASGQEELEALIAGPLADGQQVDVYVEGLTVKQVRDYVQSLGVQFHVSDRRTGVALCAWGP